MRKLLLLILTLSALFAKGQQNNTTNTKFVNGLQAPSGATEVPTSGLTAGAIFYKTGTGFRYYDGSAWQTVGISGAGVTSFNTRTGAVTLTSGDVTTALGYTPQTAITLAAIGSSPNANAATLSSGTFTLQPASASFGGVVTTGAQTFAGTKNFTGGLQLNGVAFATNSANINFLYSASTGFAVTDNTGGTNLLTVANTTGNTVVAGTFTTAGQATFPALRLTSVTGVAGGTDSLLSKNATTNVITKIPATYYAPATGGSYVSSVSGTSNRITSSGGTTPVIDISSSYVGQSSITTLGTITTGVWNAGAVTSSGAISGTTGTFSTSTTTPLLIGGTAVGSNIIYKSTTGTGTVTGIAHQFTGGTNGATVISTMLNNGNTGMGVTAPLGTLQLGNNSSGTGEPTNQGLLILQAGGNGPEAVNGVVFKTSGSGSGYGSKIYTNAASDYFGIASRFNSATWTEHFVIKQQTGNVGIGFTAPVSKLAIDGGLHVGGTTDAGDNNLLVDGTTTGTGGFLGALNGTVGATTPAAGTFTTATVTTVSNNMFYANGGASTSPLAMKWTNGGGNYFIGIDQSTGGYWTGGTAAYSMIIATESAREITFITNNAKRLSITSTGLIGAGFDTPLSKLAVNGGLHVGGESDAGDNNLLVDGTSLLTGAVTNSSLTASQLVATNGSKVLVSITDLPNGTTATTQSASDNSTKVATTAYVDAVVGGTSSSYTPTAADVTNTSARTPVVHYYVRVGNIVTVTGYTIITTTTGPNVNTVFNITLPVASNLAAATDLVGTASMSRATYSSGYVVGDASGDKAEVHITSAGAADSGVVIAYEFKYIVQ